MEIMKKHLAFIILINNCLFTSGQNWKWGKQAINSSNAASNWIAADKVGNAYICGGFNKRIIFSKDTLFSNGIDAFLVKYDTSGNEIWAKQALINDSNDYNGVNVDAVDDSGNVIITGFFNDTISFGSITLFHGGIFIVKYDPNGNVLWARQSDKGTPATCGVACITSGINNNIIITGGFSDTLIFGTTTLIPTKGFQNCFIAKYDPNGNLIWADQSIGRTVNSEIGSSSVSTDRTGNIYITGYLKDSAWFGTTKLYSSQGSMFLIKYNPMGNVIWAAQASGQGNINSIVNDNFGSSYITGSFSSNISFGSISLITTLPNSVFLVKYDSMGNAIWAESASNGTEWEGCTLSIDFNNHIYLAGFGNNDTITFGGSTFSDNKIYSTYKYCLPAFLIKLDTVGKALCGSILHAGVYIEGNFGWVTGCSCPNGKFSYLAGSFSYDTLYCGYDSLIADSTYDAYLVRLNDCNTSDGISNIEKINVNFTVFPNPSYGIFNLDISQQPFAISSIEVYNEFGQKVYFQSKNQNSKSKIDLTNQPDGIYTLKLKTENGIIVKKLVIF